MFDAWRAVNSSSRSHPSPLELRHRLVPPSSTKRWISALWLHARDGGAVVGWLSSGVSWRNTALAPRFKFVLPLWTNRLAFFNLTFLPPFRLELGSARINIICVCSLSLGHPCMITRDANGHSVGQTSTPSGFQHMWHHRPFWVASWLCFGQKVLKPAQKAPVSILFKPPATADLEGPPSSTRPTPR